jgi:hypothetical protein
MTLEVLELAGPQQPYAKTLVIVEMACVSAENNREL